MVRAPRSPFVALLVAAVSVHACGGEVPVTVSSPRPVAAPAPAPSRARWLLAPDDGAIMAKVRLGDGRTLYVGKNGVRELGDGTPTSRLVPAPAIVLDDFVGVQRDAAGSVVFVASDGATYRSADPLGPLSSPRPGPQAAGARRALKSLTTGAVAILAVTEDRRLLRSTDHGASWGEVAYARASKVFGYPAEVALDSQGNGILLHFPQRLFVTHDDGATWAPLSTGNLGARCVTRDGADQIFVCGHHGRALRLERDNIDIVRPEDFVPLHASSDARLEGTEPLHDTHLPMAIGPKGWMYVASSCRGVGGDQKCGYQQVRPIGAAALEDMLFDEPFEPTAFVFDEARDRVVALGRHDQEVALYESRLSENRFKRKRLVLSASSTPFLTLDSAGVLHVFAYDRVKSAWVMNRVDVHGDGLSPLYLPFEEASSFVFAGVHGLAFERPHDSAWAMDDGRYAVWETADAGQTWSRVAAPRGFDGHAQCTEAGCLEGTISRVGWDLPALGGVETLAATAQPEPRPGRRPTSPPSPSAPSAARPREELVCEPAGAKAVVPSFPGSNLTLRTIVDAWGAGVRWALVKGTWHETSAIDPNEAISVLVGTRTDVRDLPLFPAIATRVRADIRSGLQVSDDSVLVARYETHDGWQGRSPLDVQLAFWSAATGRVSHAVVRQVPPFDVSPYSSSVVGAARVVDGGLLFQPPSSSAAYFVHDDGRVEPVTLPPGISLTDALRLGKRWFLTEARGADADVWSKDDGDASWTERSWTLGEFRERRGGYDILEQIPFDTALSVFQGKPFLAVAGPWKGIAFPLEGEIAVDPPPPAVFDVSDVDAPCGVGAGTRSNASAIPSESGVRLRVEGGANGQTLGQLTAYRRVTHETEAGGVCTSAYVLHGTDPKRSEAQDGLLYPDGKGWSGWWFSGRPDPKRKGEKLLETVPLRCDGRR